MEPNVYDKVKDVDLKSTMESSYIDYAMSVIVSRALPDVKDGLKPVQRRILYAALKMGATSDKKTKKCATIVGETMGHYHPHGDSSIYGALVNLGQPWSTRYPLIEKQGNFGSDDGDPPAAARYTEGRLSKISSQMLDSINKDTVDFVPNFSNEPGYDEPVVLPARIPNILVNGTTGIAVGMATNIPPHNLREVIDAAVLMIENRIKEDRDTDLEEILKIVQGPDFPTGANILGKRGIDEAYRTGRGKIRMRAICETGRMPNGKGIITVKELPFMVSRSRVIESIADLVKEKKIDGITAVNDTNGKNSNSKISIELRKDVNPEVILNQLYKHTKLQDTFGVNMLCIVNGEPRILNLKQILSEYLRYQEDIVKRRTQFDLNKALDRAHILEGLLKALDHIDEIINIIRSSEDTAEAKDKLKTQYEFSDIQAQNIVDMRLRALTGLERKKIEDEYDDLAKKISYYQEILGDKKKLLTVIKDELSQISDKYGDERRTKIIPDNGEMMIEDLIPDDRMIITMSKLGYVKRMNEDNFHTQNRGGKGIRGTQTIDNDYVDNLIMTTNHQYILFFTNMGRVYRLKAYEIPVSSRTSRGTAIINLIPLQNEEHITALITLKEDDFAQEGANLIMSSKFGMIKKTSLKDFSSVRKNGLLSCVLKEGDELVEVKIAKGNDKILLITSGGMAICFNEKSIRKTGRLSQGVKGIKLKDKDNVINMLVMSKLCENNSLSLLFISESGLGKRTRLNEFHIQGRSGKGVICYRINQKTGNLVAAKVVGENSDILLITNYGQMIRTAVKNVPIVGRNAFGVRIMNLSKAEGEKIADITEAENQEDSFV